MRAHRIASVFAAATIAALLAGCGGGSSAPAPRTPSSAHAAAQATLRVVVPAPSIARPSANTRHARYVSPSTMALAVTFAPTAGGTPQTFDQNLTTANPNCAAYLVSTLACNLTFDLTPGNYTASFTTYDAVLSAAGTPTGNVLSQNQSVPMTISGSAPNALSVTLQGVPTALVAFPGSGLSGSAANTFSLGICGPTSAAFSVVAADADGNFIVGAGAPAITVTSLNTALLTVVPPTAAAPSTYELSASNPGNVPLHVTASAAAGGTGSVSTTYTIALYANGC